MTNTEATAPDANMATIGYMIHAIVNGATRLGRHMGSDRLYATDENHDTFIVEFHHISGRATLLRDSGDIALRSLAAAIARDARNNLRNGG